jgi:hypothetical protein
MTITTANESEAGPHGHVLAWMIPSLKEGLKAIHVLESGRVPAVRVGGVTSSGQFTADAEQVLGAIISTLKTSGRLFGQGNTLIFLQGGNGLSAACQPAVIAVDGAITKTASALLSNVIMCFTKKANSLRKNASVDHPPEYDQTFEVPDKILQQVVVSDGFMDTIEKADIILNHPVFDKDYQWLGAGYHEIQKILICGQSCEPAAVMPVDVEGPSQAMSVEEVLERLPSTIRAWVRGFNWADAVDLVNYIGSAMMIPLMPMLVDDGHPGVIFWGNKPGIGKSLAAQCLAILKDGRKAAPTSPDGGAREIENQILSELSDGRTVLFLDNQKGNLNVSTLEANMTASELAFRAFHVQRKVRRPNVVLWLITTNDGMPSDDFLSRCVHVRLHYEGVAEKKSFAWTERELYEYVEVNRLSILGELGGMIQAWLDAGSPSGGAISRFRVFGTVVGGVLSHWGLAGFLSNTRDEFQENSEKHQQLVALAGRLIDSRDGAFVFKVDGDIEVAAEEFCNGPRPVNPKEQKDWVPYLISAGAITATCSTSEKQKTAATRYLKSVLRVPVEIEEGEQTVEAMIVSRSLGKRRKAYALAVKGLSAAGVIDDGDETGDVAAVEAKGTDASLTAPGKLTAGNQAGEDAAEPSTNLRAGSEEMAGDETDENDLWVVD